MKSLVLLLSLCVCPYIVWAQTTPASTAATARAANLINASKFAEAQKMLEAQLAQTKIKTERDELRAALADTHYFWAQRLKEKGDVQGAIARWLRAFEIDKTLRHREAAVELTNIGIAYNQLSRYPEALRYFDNALPFIREVKEREVEAVTLNRIGTIYQKLGRYSESLAPFERALNTTRELKNAEMEAATLGNLGGAYRSLSRYEEALRCYGQALPIQQQIKDQRGQAVTLNILGVTYLNLSRYEAALRAFEGALPLYREVKDRQGEASLLNNLGALNQTLTRYEPALNYYLQALPIYREIKERDGEATVINSIGVICAALGQQERALELYESSLRIYRELKDRDGEATALHNIGSTYGNLGRYPEALRTYEQVLTIQRAIKDLYGEGSTRDNIGQVYQKLGDVDAALRNYESSLPIRRAIKDRAGEATTLVHLMLAYQEQNRPALAILFGKQSVNVTQSIRRNMTGMDKASRDAYLAGKAGIYQTLARLLIGEGRFTEAEEISAMLQQDEFLDFVRRDARGVKMETLDSDLIGTEKTVIAEQNAKIGSVALLADEEYQLSDLDKPTAAQSARLKQVQLDLGTQRGKLDAFWKALPARFERNAADVAGDRDQLSTIVPLLREMGTKSGSKVALISAFVDDKGLELLLTLPSGQTVNLSYAADETAQNGFAFPSWLNAQIFDFKEKIKARAPVDNAATALWNVVGCRGELGAQLDGAGIQTVMWRLTGPLRAIPLPALRDKDGYLVEKYRNVVLTAGSTPNLAHDPVGDWRVLGLGVTRARTVGDDSFPALTGVEGELRAVVDDPDDGFAGGAMPGKVLRDADFSQTSFFRALRGPTAESNAPWQVVHIASHFKLASDDLKSFLLTGDGTLSLAELKERAQTRPLFPGVELMTLSACDTASGADNLGALAELNGARSVLATLWPVADKETAQLMADFYANHTATPTAGKAAALQNAQLKLLHGGGVAAHPYYWAPFVLMGNWR